MFRPDFLIIPYAIKECRDLRPSDLIVFAVVYWFEHLKDGKCIASNATIAEIAMVDERTVRVGLERLEKQGFVERVFADAERKDRMEIRTLVRFARSQKEGKVKKAKKETGIEVSGEGEETPGEYARKFFDKEALAVRTALVEEIAQQAGAPTEAIWAEVKKFFVYWTEPNKSGTKQKWELERTFEVKRRLYTWLSRAGKFSSAGAGRKRAGAGMTV